MENLRSSIHTASLDSTPCHPQVTLGGAHGEGERARRKLRQLAQTATDIITDNKFTVPVTRTVGLDEVAAALDEMFHAHTSGKVVFVAE